MASPNLSAMRGWLEISRFDPSNAGQRNGGRDAEGWPRFPRTPVELFIELPRQEDDTAVCFSGRCTKLFPEQTEGAGQALRRVPLRRVGCVAKTCRLKAHKVQRCFVGMAKRKCWRRMLNAVDDVDEGNRSLKKKKRKRYRKIIVSII